MIPFMCKDKSDFLCIKTGKHIGRNRDIFLSYANRAWRSNIAAPDKAHICNTPFPFYLAEYAMPYILLHRKHGFSDYPQQTNIAPRIIKEENNSPNQPDCRKVFHVYAFAHTEYKAVKATVLRIHQ